MQEIETKYICQHCLMVTIIMARCPDSKLIPTHIDLICIALAFLPIYFFACVCSTAIYAHKSLRTYFPWHCVLKVFSTQLLLYYCWLYVRLYR